MIMEKGWETIVSALNQTLELCLVLKTWGQGVTGQKSHLQKNTPVVEWMWGKAAGVEGKEQTHGRCLRARHWARHIACKVSFWSSPSRFQMMRWGERSCGSQPPAGKGLGQDLNILILNAGREKAMEGVDSRRERVIWLTEDAQNWWKIGPI